MPTNHTQNYRLSQWAKTDQVKMEDFNADNAKIDAALKAEADARTGAVASLSQTVSAHGAAIAKLGDCQIYTTSYTGDGQSGEEHPIQLTFPHPPMLVAVQSYHGVAMVLVRDSTAFAISNYQPCVVTWSGNTVSFYSTNNISQMNSAGRPYYVTALCSKS